MRSPTQELIAEIRDHLKPIGNRIHRGDGDQFVERAWLDIVDQIKELAASSKEAARQEKLRDRGIEP